MSNFVMMYELAQSVFWTILILYLVTLSTVNYVGVHLTYIAIPVIVVSGMIMKITRPNRPKTELDKALSQMTQFSVEAITKTLEITEEATYRMNWHTWKLSNRDNLKHIAGYEEQFVNQVLAQISLIEPKDVVSQYHFCDDTGKNRYS